MISQRILTIAAGDGSVREVIERDISARQRADAAATESQIVGLLREGCALEDIEVYYRPPDFRLRVRMKPQVDA